MPHVLTHQRTEDYSAWRAAFDSQADRRTAAGCRSAQAFRTIGDPNQIVVLLDFDSTSAIERYMSAPDLKKAHAAAKVVDENHLLLEPA